MVAILSGRTEEKAQALFKQHLHPTQELAFDTPANEILFGGAKGPGKSYLMRFAMSIWSMQAPGLQCYLFRRLFPDLWKNHMEGPTSFPNMLGALEAADYCSIVGHEVRWWNGARIFLNHLQHEKNLSKYQGPEIHVLGLDELTQFSESQYRYLRASVRLGSWEPPEKLKGVFPRIIAGANPGGLGHAWVKRTFINHGPYKLIKCKKLPPDEDGQNEGPMLRQFIPARAEDNPELLRNDPDYLERLEGMGNLALVRAMREGDWNVISGSMFGDVWRNNRHVVVPFPIPSNWPIWRGGDDGYASPMSIHWLAENPDTGTIYVIDELYGSKFLPEHAAEEILKADGTISINYGEEVDVNDAAIYGIMDSAAFSNTGTGAQSRAGQMNTLGCNWRPVEKPTGSRIMRVQAVHRALRPNLLEEKDSRGQHMPGLQVFNTCQKLIEYLPQIPISPDNPEDVDKAYAFDHVLDSLSYGLTRQKRLFATKRVTGI